MSLSSYFKSAYRSFALPSMLDNFCIWVCPALIGSLSGTPARNRRYARDHSPAILSAIERLMEVACLIQLMANDALPDLLIERAETLARIVTLTQRARIVSAASIPALIAV